MTSAPMQPNARVVAYYLPQFHVVSENEEWWGSGFTDWDNVKRARPLFPGHRQPRVPLGGNYYDLTEVDALRWQVEIAKAYGLSAFCHYHYWFDGKRMLERPTDLFLEQRELDFQFCLAWANATWSRRWKSNRRGSRILIRQTYSSDPRRWLEHFECLFEAWSDRRHLCVDGKPVFLIYQPQDIPQTGAMFDLWRREAERRGLAGLHLVAMQLFPFVRNDFLAHYDAITLGQPGAAMFIPGPDDRIFGKVSFERFLRGLPHDIAAGLQFVRSMLPGTLRFHDYDEIWRRILEQSQPSPRRIYRGAFVDLDNTPRYERTARVTIGANPERFAYWFNRLVASAVEQPRDERLIFVNAWNEWAEGAYLEPDETFGYGYLQAIKDAVGTGVPAASS